MLFGAFCKALIISMLEKSQFFLSKSLAFNESIRYTSHVNRKGDARNRNKSPKGGLLLRAGDSRKSFDVQGRICRKGHINKMKELAKIPRK